MCACRRSKSFLIADILGEPPAPSGSPYPCPAPAPAPAGAGSSPMRRYTYPVCPLPLRYPPPAPPAPPAPAAAHAAHAAPLPPLPAPPCCALPPLLPPPALRHAYSLDIGAWWRGVGGGAGAGAGAGAGGARRAGGQVRFSAAQAGALERRFGSARYLSPEQRRRLARDLRLSDRQVKTWFQNRRAKWRRAATGAGGPARPDRDRAPGDEAVASEREAECEAEPAGERDSDSAPPPPPPPHLPRRLGTVLAPEALQRAY